jgi:hypothetical protein
MTRAILSIPMRAINESNAREHPMARHRRVAKERTITRLMWSSTEARQVREVAELYRPITVRIVRIGKKRMDGDGVASACKHIRDELAACLGVDDLDGDGGVWWEYAQEIAPWYAVRVEVEVRAP